MSFKDSLLQSLGRIAKDVVRGQLDQRTRRSTTRTKPRRTPSAKPSGTPGEKRSTVPNLGKTYPGDFAGRPEISYAPQPGRVGDPGEVVWCWVPYEEDHAQGKDRPVLLIGRDGDWLLGLPLTSKDHDRDEAQEAAAGRHWMDIGTGAWDSKNRASEARLDRIVRVDPRTIRGSGHALDKELFGRVAAAVRRRVR